MSTMSATYSPEDNKLRLYPIARLGAETYARVKAAGFRWAPKQELFVASGWSPDREDLLLVLCGEIGDEDYSPEERAADRAERFADYRDKRADEAGASADAFEADPAAFGHQNRNRAERQAARHDRKRVYSVSQWSKAEYWQRRTQGVIGHALYKSSAPVRRSRILRLEAEQRKHEKNREEYTERFRDWEKVLTLEGLDQAVTLVENDRFCGIDPDASGPAAALAYALANSGHCWGDYPHPRSERKTSLYSLMTAADDPITAREAAELWLANHDDPADPESNSARWSNHYNLRLTYERAMLAEEGGTVAEADIEPGGWFGSHQVQKVNRSPATGRVVSIGVIGPHPWRKNKDGTPVIGVQRINIERLPADAYRPPTDEERAQFKEDTKERKSAEKATKPKAPALINPTGEEADRLQDLLNRIGEAKFNQNSSNKYQAYVPTLVLELTQAEYSQLSKGTYSHFETRTLHNSGGIIARRSSNMYTSEGTAYDKALGPAVCKIRVRYSSGWYNPPHIVVISDKPQKSLPLDWEAVACAMIDAENGKAVRS